LPGHCIIERQRPLLHARRPDFIYEFRVLAQNARNPFCASPVFLEPFEEAKGKSVERIAEHFFLVGVENLGHAELDFRLRPPWSGDGFGRPPTGPRDRWGGTRRRDPCFSRLGHQARYFLLRSLLRDPQSTQALVLFRVISRRDGRRGGSGWCWGHLGGGRLRRRGGFEKLLLP